MLLHAMLCYAMLCHAMLCYAMLCHPYTPIPPYPNPKSYPNQFRIWKDQFVLVECIPCKNEVVYAGDAAFQRKCGKGASGEKSKTPCHICPTCRNGDDSNMGHVFVLVVAPRGSTLGDLCHKYDMSLDQLIDAHNPSNHAEYAALTGVGTAGCALDNRKPVDLTTRSYNAQTKCSEVRIGRGQKRLFRVRLVWPTSGEGTRELKDMFNHWGHDWGKFIMCALHEVLRSTEWLLHNTIRYSGKTPSQVQKALDVVGSKLQALL